MSSSKGLVNNARVYLQTRIVQNVGYATQWELMSTHGLVCIVSICSPHKQVIIDQSQTAKFDVQAWIWIFESGGIVRTLREIDQDAKTPWRGERA